MISLNGKKKKVNERISYVFSLINDTILVHLFLQANDIVHAISNIDAKKWSLRQKWKEFFPSDNVFDDFQCAFLL